MVIEHNVISTGEIHEPKDVITAAANLVYVTDGVGSGTMTRLKQPAKLVLVETASDFPTPSGGVITLADNTYYQVSGTVSIGTDRIVKGANSPIIGLNASVDILVYTGTGTAITASDNSIFMRDVTLSLTSTGTAFSFTDSGVTKFFIVEGCGVVGVAGSTIGTASGGSGTVLNRSQFLNFDNPLTFTGTMTGFSIDTCSFTGNDDLFVLDASLVITSGDVLYTIFNTGSGDTVLTDSGAAITELIGFSHCVMSGAGSFGTGFETDVDYCLIANAGFTNSKYAGQGYIVGSALNTSFSGTGAGNEVIVNFGAAFLSDIEDQFTISTAGRFTYDGKPTKEFFVDCTMYATQSGGAAREYIFYVKKNGTTIITSSGSKREYTSGTPGSNSCTTVIEMATTDYFELFVMAVTATTDLNVDTSSIKIISK